MKTSELCSWCNVRPRGYGDLLCVSCRAVLKSKQEQVDLHVTLDDHIEACRYCKNPKAMCCTIGSKLLADATASDGRLDREYAKEFGGHDPCIWYLMNREDCPD